MPSTYITSCRTQSVFCLSNQLMFLIVFAAVALLCSPYFTYAGDVSLAWDENTEQDLAGYRVFHRQEGQAYNYTTPSWEGVIITCTISGFNDDLVNYFVVRAFDDSGSESSDSNEVFFRKGDVNSDKEVTIIDAQLCVNIVLGTETDPQAEARATNIAEPSDECDVLDLQELVNIILGP
ncbi:MAG: hypothetical protein ACMUJM_21760 [bacterium]